MPCYCNDIYRITQDIAHLNSMLTKLNSLSQEDSMLTSELSELSGSLSGMATPSNSNSAADKIAQLQKNMAGKTSSLQGAVSGEITRLGSMLTSLRAQDISYHTSLQRLL